jgi:hypothetical protein
VEEISKKAMNKEGDPWAHRILNRILLAPYMGGINP